MSSITILGHYHHEYDVVYESRPGELVQSRHSHDHGYRHSHVHPDEEEGYEPIPIAVRRVQQQHEEKPPQLPNTPPPKSPKSFAQIVEDKPISVAERLLTKTPSLERRQRHAASSIGRKDTGSSDDTTFKSEHTEQRLSPFGTRKTYISEKKKWFDEDETSMASIRDQADEIHRAVHSLRFVVAKAVFDEFVVNSR